MSLDALPDFRLTASAITASARRYYNNVTATVKKHPRRTAYYATLTAASFVSPVALSALVTSTGFEAYWAGSPRKNEFQTRLWKTGITAFWTGIAFCAIGVRTDASRKDSALDDLRPAARQALVAANQIHVGDSLHAESGCKKWAFYPWNDHCKVSVDAQVIDYKNDPNNGQFFKIKFIDSEGGTESHRYQIEKPSVPWPSGYEPNLTKSFPAPDAPK